MACGEQHFVAACELGLKGVSKRGDAPYRSGPAVGSRSVLIFGRRGHCSALLKMPARCRC